MEQHEKPTMKHLVYGEFGEPDVLTVAETTIPEPGPEEVLVRVRAAGLNPIDWKTRRGLGFAALQIRDHLPWTPGYDLAGEVVAVGEKVATLLPGDRVMGMVGFPGEGGACARYRTASAEELVIVPDELDLVAAAALPLAGLTAWQALYDVGELDPGQKVLIHAGAGGVGHLAVQFALARGAHVLATASSDNRDFLAGLGVHEVIDYHAVNFEDECYGLDLVIDLVGGDTGKRSLKTLSEQGIIVTVPTVTADEIVSEAERLGLRAHGMTVQPDVFQLEEILELIEDGQVKVHVDGVFALEDAPAAHRLLESGHVRGKLVLDLEIEPEPDAV